MGRMYPEARGALWRQSKKSIGLLRDLWRGSGPGTAARAEAALAGRPPQPTVALCGDLLVPCEGAALAAGCSPAAELTGWKSRLHGPLVSRVCRDVRLQERQKEFPLSSHRTGGFTVEKRTGPMNYNYDSPAGPSSWHLRPINVKCSPVFAGNVTTFRSFLTCRPGSNPEIGAGVGASSRVVPPGGFLALNNLRDNPGSRQQKTRLGRGIGSGKGKTAGRGHKGQKARNGNKPRLGFEGGQTPLRLTLPKRGFHNPFSLDFQEVNLGTIAKKVNDGVIDASQLITMKTLKDTRTMGKATRDGVKLLGRGAEKFTHPIHIEVSRVSKRAKEAIEAAGGSVVRVHYNKLGLRALLKPEWFAKKGRLLPRPARPPPRLLSAVDRVGRLPAPTTPLPLEAAVNSAVSQ